MVKTYPKNSERKLSNNFYLSEFHCKCKYESCTYTYLDTDLIDYLQKKRDLVGLPFTINSGFRCTKYNRDVKGKSGSIHLTGKAADIVIQSKTVSEMLKIFSDADGLGEYQKKKFVHVDKRGYRARWKG